MLELEAIEMSNRIKQLKQELGYAFRHQQPCQAVRYLWGEMWVLGECISGSWVLGGEDSRLVVVRAHATVIGRPSRERLIIQQGTNSEQKASVSDHSGSKLWNADDVKEGWTCHLH